MTLCAYTEWQTSSLCPQNILAITLVALFRYSVQSKRTNQMTLVRGYWDSSYWGATDYYQEPSFSIKNNQSEPLPNDPSRLMSASSQVSNFLLCKISCYGLDTHHYITSLGYDPFHNQLSLPGADTGTGLCLPTPHIPSKCSAFLLRRPLLPSLALKKSRETYYPTQLIAGSTHYYE